MDWIAFIKSKCFLHFIKFLFVEVAQIVEILPYGMKKICLYYTDNTMAADAPKI